MKMLVKLIFLAVMISLLGGKEGAAEGTLQSQIDALPDGAVFKLAAGIYDEALVLKKPIILEGTNGTILKVCSSEPALSISGKKVMVKQVKIIGCQKAESPAAIFISGKQHQLEDITVEYDHLGLELEEVNNSTFRNISVTGKNKKNGFDLWESNHNTFEDCRIDHVQDGFYLESSHNNTFSGNTISNSRYGLHVMFSDYITVKNNRSTGNFTGAMVMGTNYSVIADNQLMENNQNVNAQGLLLYDVHDSIINNNRISHNRVGMFVEDSSGNKIKGNEITANFIGAQMNRIEKNMIVGNTFISNVNDFQATDGTDNKIQRNYWDAALKLDTDGDGKSNLPHSADPFFLNLARETPPYQLFFQHPGMTLLQKMLKSPEELLVTDKEPLMNNVLHKQQQSNQQKPIFWFICAAMIVSSLLIIYFGRKRT
ncbi:right-handed parallel beta-helix repeat-containing protein [Neobacillus vireti]|uniref:Nitrous oxide reductase maturation protein NosD n=1 Tax=Neobacillus vireti LMG 21834 TaxID=1131730 RepID=A0AB94ISJ6_9BACI|nr:NosD domain-containing protein [Neobacillus vireti]ETI70080.1 Nitrous oxide reductase maturation protein NosD [Neobacillus vireti LMG 21834]KLT18304.1 hypothetical protein AA980_08230 [Neobacillus vireti]